MTRYEPAAAEREWLRTASTRLHQDFQGTFGRETIEQLLSSSRERLAENATTMTFIPLLAERFARERLQAAAKAQGGIMHAKPAVLFLCVHNAGRSQMAAAWLQHLAGDRVTVYSGGSTPASHVNPAAIEAMREVGIDMTSNYPKPWTMEALEAADIVVTMGCGDACPVLPGKRYLDWQIDDPAGKAAERVRPIRDQIRSKVQELIAEIEALRLH